MGIILGISIALNIICAIIIFLMYKYSIKGIKNTLETSLLNNFMKNDIDWKDFYDNK